MRWLLTLALCLLTAPLWAQEPGAAPVPSPEPETPPAASEGAPEPCPGGTCVPDEDMAKIVEVLKEKKCLQTTKPEFDLDPINIVVDRDGRIFYSGAEPHPYSVRMNWCNYEVEATGKVDIVAAMREPPIWGFRFRPKAYIGVLPGEAFYSLPEDDSIHVMDLVDAGVMVDFLYYDWANLNAAVGFRSLGAGIGFDLTSNFGAYGGYALTWGDWHHNANLSLWFSFWNPEP